MPEPRKALELNPQPPLGVTGVSVCPQSRCHCCPKVIQSTHVGKSRQNQSESAILYDSFYIHKAEMKRAGLVQKLQVNLTGVLFFTSDWSH